MVRSQIFIKEESREEYLLEQKKMKEERDSIISDWPLFIQNCLEFAGVYLRSTDLHARYSQGQRMRIKKSVFMIKTR